MGSKTSRHKNIMVLCYHVQIITSHALWLLKQRIYVEQNFKKMEDIILFYIKGKLLYFTLFLFKKKKIRYSYVMIGRIWRLSPSLLYVTQVIK